jgi:acetyltransferase-like isoleucine patch superfamily enzyme
MNKFLVRFFASLYYRYNREEFQKIKLIKNVSIDENFDIGRGSYISVPENKCKKLIIGKNVLVKRNCNFLVYPEGSLVIHENVFFNNGCSVNCLENIEIGANTLFGEAVKLYDHNHKYHLENDQLIVEREKFKTGRIRIGKNCWIGSNVTILNNVEIGDNVIIGANCLIYQSVASNSIVKQKEELIITPCV